MNYTDINSKTIDSWNKDGWEWARMIDHETYEKALNGDWGVYLSPTKTVPKDWFCEMKNAKILGLASGGGQQMPIFSALGSKCTVMDYSKEQLKNEEIVSKREGYDINIVHGDMTKIFPFEDESFDLIFHPVSNCYIEDVSHVWKECFRVLKKGGILLAGFDNEINFAFDENDNLKYVLPYNPLKDEELLKAGLANNDGVQFSHSIEEQIGEQLKAGFMLCDIYGDTNGFGILHEHNVATFYCTKALKR